MRFFLSACLIWTASAMGAEARRVEAFEIELPRFGQVEASLELVRGKGQRIVGEATKITINE